MSAGSHLRGYRVLLATSRWTGPLPTDQSKGLQLFKKKLFHSFNNFMFYFPAKRPLGIDPTNDTEMAYESYVKGTQPGEVKNGWLKTICRLMRL